jgi:hypothetical protein
VGDFNVEAEDFSALKDILHNSWTDVGADAHMVNRDMKELAKAPMLLNLPGETTSSQYASLKND